LFKDYAQSVKSAREAEKYKDGVPGLMSGANTISTILWPSLLNIPRFQAANKKNL